jgi:hypothetical protein
LEDCLERYPQHRDSLRSLLEVAQTLQEHQLMATPSPHFVVDLKAKLTNESSKNRKGGEADRKRS